MIFMRLSYAYRRLWFRFPGEQVKIATCGEVAEWSNALDLKSRVV